MRQDNLSGSTTKRVLGVDGLLMNSARMDMCWPVLGLDQKVTREAPVMTQLVGCSLPVCGFVIKI